MRLERILPYLEVMSIALVLYGGTKGCNQVLRDYTRFQEIYQGEERIVNKSKLYVTQNQNEIDGSGSRKMLEGMLSKENK